MLIGWSQFFRDICSRWLIDHPIRLGGVGHVVQIDESLLARRKYNIGHQVNEQWIFDVHAGIGVIRLVQNRNRATLLPIIEEYVLPGSTNKNVVIVHVFSGTTIHSDQWGAYMHGAIAAIPVIPPYIHRSVNHTQNFVCPLDGTHTNHVESFWRNIKMKFKAMSGTSREMLAGYLDEHMWRQFNGRRTLTAFDNILDQISEYYVVNA